MVGEKPGFHSEAKRPVRRDLVTTCALPKRRVWCGCVTDRPRLPVCLTVLQEMGSSPYIPYLTQDACPFGTVPCRAEHKSRSLPLRVDEYAKVR